MIGLIIGALIALFVMLPASSPRADISRQVFEAICNDRAAVLKYLTERHGEAPVGVGILGNGAGLAELHTAPGRQVLDVHSDNAERDYVRSGGRPAMGDGCACSRPGELGAAA